MSGPSDKAVEAAMARVEGLTVPVAESILAAAYPAIVQEAARYREALERIVKRAVEVPIGAPAFPLARGLGDIAMAALEAATSEESR